ncbi:MAG: TonB-dependent receptor [Candidatus Omnitrophota bacterium]
MKRVFVCMLVVFMVLGDMRIFAAAEKKEANSDKVTVKEVIVSASRVEEDASRIASDVVIITEEDLKEQKVTYVIDALRNVPGIHVAQNGIFGGLSSVYLRGVSTGQTLVMIDGMRVFDPMSTDASFNAAHMSIDNVERIEIIKGPQSVLYGSNAIGGVINIITKRGKGRPSFETDGSIGYWRTYQGRTSFSGSCDMLDFSFSASGVTTDGISKVNERENAGERDFYKNYTFDGRLDWNLTDTLSYGIEARYNDAWLKYDDGGNQDDMNRYGTAETILVSSYFDAMFFEALKSTLSFAFMRFRREDEDQNDGRDLEENYSFFHGKDIKAGWQNTLFINDFDTVTAGCEFEYEEGNSDTNTGSPFWNSKSTISTRMNAVRSFYANNVFHAGGLYITTGLRNDRHSRWGNYTTYRFAGAYDFEWRHLDTIGFQPFGVDWSEAGCNTKVRGSYGTGFKSPSIYQIYSPFGRDDLQPEKSWGWEFGIEQGFLDKKLFGEITYFGTDVKNLINFDLINWVYENLGTAEMEGLEVSFHIIPVDWFKIKGGYTYYNKTRDKNTHDRLIKRPKDRFSVNVDWVVFVVPLYKDQSMKGRVNFNTLYVGNRHDRFGWPVREELLQAYYKFDLISEISVTDYFSVYWKIDNLTDRFYEEVYGFATPERNHTVGVKCTIPF